jgi:hypothetical protein
VASEHLDVKKHAISFTSDETMEERNKTLIKFLWKCNTQPTHTLNEIQFTFWFACTITSIPIINCYFKINTVYVQ